MDSAFLSVLKANQSVKALTPRTSDYLERLNSLLPADVLKLSTSSHYGEQSKQVTVHVPEDFADRSKRLQLLAIGDVQFGHKDVKYDALKKYVSWVLQKPYRFVLLTGDMCDAAHAYTPGSTWDNIFDVQSQVYKFVEMFAPIRHRILGYVGGNHERRTLKVFGDLGVLLATMLKVPYSNGRQYISIHFGTHKPFRIMLWHGHPRARTKGALAQIMDRYMQIGNAHLYVTGHNHQGLVVPNFREIDEGGRLKIEKFMGFSGTSFLETYGSYAEWMGFTAYDILMPRVNIYRDGSWEAIVR